jgi:hypothetical protein
MAILIGKYLVMEHGFTIMKLKTPNMKKRLINLMVIIIPLCMLVSSCKKEKDEMLKYKQIAWNSLSETSKGIIIQDWKDANAMFINNPDNANEKVVLVTFVTNVMALSGPINVYIDLETQTVIHPVNIPLAL